MRSLAALQMHAEHTYLQESVSDAIKNARKVTAIAEIALGDHDPGTALNSPCSGDVDEAALALVGLGDTKRTTTPPKEAVQPPTPIVASATRPSQRVPLRPEAQLPHQSSTHPEPRVTLRDTPRLLGLLNRVVCSPRGAMTSGGQCWTTDVPMFVLGQLTSLANSGGLETIRQAGGVAAIERLVAHFSPPSMAVHALPILDAALKLLLQLERVSAVPMATPCSSGVNRALEAAPAFAPRSGWGQLGQFAACQQSTPATATAWALPPRTAAVPQATAVPQAAASTASVWPRAAATPSQWSTLPRAAALPQPPPPAAAVAAALWGGAQPQLRQPASVSGQYMTAPTLLATNGGAAPAAAVPAAVPATMPAAHGVPLAQATPIARIAPPTPWRNRLPTPAVPTATMAPQAPVPTTPAVPIKPAVQATTVKAKAAVAAVPTPPVSAVSAVSAKRPRNDNVRVPVSRPASPPPITPRPLPAHVRPVSPGARPLSPSVSKAPTAPSSPRPISPQSQQMAENRPSARADGNLLKQSNVGAALYDLLSLPTGGSGVALIPGIKRQRSLSKLAM